MIVREPTYIMNEKDYYLDDKGNFVFTEAYHLRRGSCCGNGCRHCPWSNLSGKKDSVTQLNETGGNEHDVFFEKPDGSGSEPKDGEP